MLGILTTDGSASIERLSTASAYIVTTEVGRIVIGVRGYDCPPKKCFSMEAESEAIENGLRAALHIGITDIVVRSDCQPLLAKLYFENRGYDSIRGLAAQFNNVRWTYISRNNNPADYLARRSMMAAPILNGKRRKAYKGRTDKEIRA